MKGTHLAAALLAASTLGVACGPRRIVAAPVAQGGGLVVLLPDPDGGPVGEASVSNQFGTITLSGELLASETAANRSPGPPTPMSEERVNEIFGTAFGALPLPPQVFLLRFKFDSNELTDESRALLPMILEVVMKRPVPDVMVIGHTDRVGDPATNLALGLRRAEAVRALLLQTGFGPSYIEVTSHGEMNPLVPTADNTPEPLNRRVEIAVR
jgi:outer membrane protein OmpA-like peptidoglycan-associated protein